MISPEGGILGFAKKVPLESLVGINVSEDKTHTLTHTHIHKYTKWKVLV